MHLRRVRTLMDRAQGERLHESSSAQHGACGLGEGANGTTHTHTLYYPTRRSIGVLAVARNMSAPSEDYALFGSAPVAQASSSPPSSPVKQSKQDDAFELFPSAQQQQQQSRQPPVTKQQQQPKQDDDSFELFPQAVPVDKVDMAAGMGDVKAEAVRVASKGDEDFVVVPPLGASNSQSSLLSRDSTISSSESTMRQMSLSDAPAVAPMYKVSGNAVDVIAVTSAENKFFTTPWHVAFSWSRWRSNVSAGVGDTVRVFINGHELPTKMQLLERGRCVFTTGPFSTVSYPSSECGLTPPGDDLNFVELHDDRINHVRFEHYQKSSETIRYVDSRLHVWGPNESVVVADLDGTLTISDVEGHIRTLRLGQYDFLHKGACDFFTKLHELGLRILYLTARPIDWASATRTHLDNATQHSHSLPPGPLITNSNGLTGALMTEVVNKNPHVFKTQVLNEIQLSLIHAGRTTEHPVFVAGFGNRPTDVVAYESVGMERAMIFLIDPYSNLRASSEPRIFESYADPNALLWLLPRLKHKVSLDRIGMIDDYTVRELVLAEEREQLLMAEQRARRLQEEEYERARRGSPPINMSGSFYGAHARTLQQ
ncbi:TPA: hypothetical protein N0F65_003906 [Lagenidium giganteum]|uniref:LNS2/PITP domain-containing protein n=1 Tax=Lagenidium giganteum TaxID=4803 RepID=A0AAV2ZA51_9STRA|nr:TPA: hypothetical protein N0F65_003906 [Lagenidium giganteum]